MVFLLHPTPHYDILTALVNAQYLCETDNRQRLWPSLTGNRERCGAQPTKANDKRMVASCQPRQFPPRLTLYTYSHPHLSDHAGAEGG